MTRLSIAATPERERSEGSGSFLKKRTKKLLLFWRLPVALAVPQALSWVKKFFCFF
jgi:hypothetical protein